MPEFEAGEDTTNALLRDHFYQNHLGKRESLKKPFPKAEALAEANVRLRELSREEALKRTASLSSGVEGGKDRPMLQLLPALHLSEAGAK